MNPSVLLVILFSAIILVGTMPVYANTSSSHPFILKWGESGLTSPGKFSNPQNIAIDFNDNVYVTDLGNKRVQKFSSDGSFLKTWGSSGSEPGKFSSPSGITASDGHVFVVDSQLHKVQKFDSDGNFVLQWGVQGNHPGEFLLPNGITSGKNGTIYVVDTGNHRVQKFDSDGNFISAFGQSGTSDDKFLSPLGIAIDDTENIYVSDTGDNSIKKFDSDGNFISMIDSSVGGTAIKVHGLTIDPEGNLYAVDAGSDRILRFNSNGIAISVWGNMGIQPGQFKMPKDVALDSQGNLYVVDTNGHRIQKFGTPIVIQEQVSATTAPQTTQDVASPLPDVNPIPGDLTKPIIIPPNDLVIEATGALTSVNVGQAVATDASGIKSLENNAPDKFTLGINTVIWTAIDGSGNMAIATQKVTISDTIPPTISPISNITIEAENPAQNTVELAEPAVSDTVGVSSITNNAPDFYPLGETQVTWTATDVMGNAATTIQTVNVVDTTNPSLYVPENITVEAESIDENQVYLGEATVIDNGEIISITNDAPEFFKIGNTTVTWMASDSSGNIASDVQLVSIVDTQPPQIVSPEPIIIEATSSDSNIVNLNELSVSDIQPVTIINDAPEFFKIGNTTVTWTVTDESGNSSNVEQIVSVVDTTAPTIIVPDDLTVEASGIAGNTVNLGDVIVEDVSSIASIINDAPESFSFGTTVVTWNVTDIYGNTATSEQTINVVDTIPPKIVAPNDIEMEATNVSENSVDLGQPTVSDLVDIASIINDAPESLPIGMTTVTWTAVDTSGNESTDIQIITISDTIPPEITAPDDAKIEANGPNPMPVSLVDAETFDAIGIESIINDAPSVFPYGDTLVTWTATDLYGNMATDVQTISVIDTVPPVVTSPQNITIEATDDATNSVSLETPEATDAVGVSSITNDAPKVFPLGNTTVVWTATDDAGNSNSVTQIISVIDTTPPTISEPELITAEATSELNQIELTPINATDAVGVSSITNDAPEVFPVGNTIVTWTVTDTSGNSANAQQTVSIIDTTPPNIYAPKSKTAEATDLLSNAVEFGVATATDAVGVSSITNDAPEVFPLGLTSITWTATDAAGNENTAIQQIHVIDTTAPVITPPEDITIEAQSLQNNSVDLGQPTASDAVELDFVTNDAPSTFALGETTVTWTATDSSGNIANATQLVRLVDTTSPIIEAPDDIVLEATSLAENTVDLGMPAASDAVSDVVITNNAPFTFALGETTVTWTATDDNGNAASDVQKVSIVDTTLPQIVVPEDIAVEATSPTENVIDIGLATATDLVEIQSITNDAPSVFPYGKTTVTWTATDTSGNSITDTQMINVIDTVSPKLSVPKNVIVEASGISENIVDIGTATANDVIQVDSLSNDAPDFFPLGDTIVTWTATDQDGNSATATQKISVVDTTAPTITPPANLVVDAISLETPISVGVATSTDVIDLAPSLSNDAPSVFPLGETIVTWTSSDSFGNVNNATQTVTVQACGKPHSSFNMIVGTNDDDVINGSPQADLIFALDGDDIIMGGKGNDCISGGDGADIIFGNEGDDTILGDQGNDVIKGQSGNDTINGGTGTDIIDGGDDVDSCTISQTDGDMVIKCE